MERYMKSHMTKMHGTTQKPAKHEKTEHDSYSSHVKPERSVSKTDQCGFKTMGKPKLNRNKKNAANDQQSALSYMYDIGQKQSIGSKTVNRVKNVHMVKNVHRVRH